MMRFIVERLPDGSEIIWSAKARMTPREIAETVKLWRSWGLDVSAA